jgi:hypothetical protein
LNHVLLIVFGSAEQPKEVRKALNDLKAFEFGTGAWLLPNAAPPAVCLARLRELVPWLRETNEPLALMCVSRHEGLVSIENWPELDDWFESARKPGR